LSETCSHHNVGWSSEALHRTSPPPGAEAKVANSAEGGGTGRQVRWICSSSSSTREGTEQDGEEVWERSGKFEVTPLR